VFSSRKPDVVVSHTLSLQEKTEKIMRVAQTQWEEISTICFIATTNFVDNDFLPNVSQFGDNGQARGREVLPWRRAPEVLGVSNYCV
jgi:hypothetical protein